MHSEEDKKRKCLILGYYLSRCDRRALTVLGFKTFREAFISLGRKIGENPNNIKNVRDEFDPYFDNGRRGWYQRNMAPSRQKIFDDFREVPDSELDNMVCSILKDGITDSRTDILENLGVLIHQTTQHYRNDFVWQDVELTEDFKKIYESYLHENGYTIDFFMNTAVITSSSTKNIFLPNQWFVIASYAVGVYLELIKYKNLFVQVTNRIGKKLDDYAKSLKECATIEEKNSFINASLLILDDYPYSDKAKQIAAERLWKFATNYTWWSGQKSIDRMDFHYSVILNMLNLINASQSYVGDIVTAFGNNSSLREMTKNLESFTKNMSGITYAFSRSPVPENDSGADPADSLSISGVEHKNHGIVISAASLERLKRRSR